MLFNLLTSLIDHYSFLNVFKYLTFRTGLSVVTSLVIVFIIGGPLIKLFSEKMITGPIRQDGPIDHIIKKSGTPTMGGVIIIIGIISSTLLWADLTNIYVWTLIFVSLSLGLLGMPGLTSYFCMLNDGNPKENETVVISGAGGMCGSVAAQLAKRRGANVVAISGSKEKNHILEIFKSQERWFDLVRQAQQQTQLDFSNDRLLGLWKELFINILNKL